MRFFRPKRPSIAQPGKRKALQSDAAEAALQATKGAVFFDTRPTILFTCPSSQRIQAF